MALFKNSPETLSASCSAAVIFFANSSGLNWDSFAMKPSSVASDCFNPKRRIILAKANFLSVMFAALYKSFKV